MKLLLRKLLFTIPQIAVVSLIVWQGTSIISDIKAKKNSSINLETITVHVNGNVKNPGTYRVPKGTTKYEILQVAGLKNSSDITPFNLASQVDNNSSINVSEKDDKVALKSSARLEFFVGDIAVLSANGNERDIEEGVSIREKDRILTEKESQVEISLNVFSRVDIDKFTEVTFDKIGIDKNGNNRISLFQKNGLCWYKVAYSDKSERIDVSTPHVKIKPSSKGADFTVNSRYSETVINCLGGLILVERPDGSDAINVISGQSVTIYNDNRPFNVTKIERDINTTQNFNKLAKAKIDIVMKHMPFNLIFISPPLAYYLISIQFDEQKIHVINIPFNTSVSFFAQGIETLNEAYLYGGPVFISTIVERILNSKIPKFLVFSKEDIIKVAAITKGLNLDIDSKASSVMNVKSGKQQLDPSKIFEYMQSSISGYNDSKTRQEAVLRAIYDQVKSKDLIINATIAEQLINNAETNITSSEILSRYSNFMNKKKWKFITHNLPVNERKEKNITVYEPDYEKARKLLIGG